MSLNECNQLLSAHGRALAERAPLLVVIAVLGAERLSAW